MVLLSITPLLDGVLRRDIIAPFHTSGPSLLQFHLAIEQWGLGNPSINFPIAFPKECFIAAITRAAGNYEHSIVITTKNKTNLSWICKGYDNSAGNTYANWLALGC